MKRFIVYFCLMVLSSNCLAEDAKVTVHINSQQHINFSLQPRLDEVLAHVIYDSTFYLPATQLFRLDTAKAETLRDSVIQKLTKLQQSSSKSKAILIHSLIEQITGWQLADRVLVKLDYDAARINSQFNPRFDNGEYRLDMHQRSPYMRFFGLIKPSILSLWEVEPLAKVDNKKCVSDYIKHDFSSLQNNDYAYVIQPNGESFKVGIAYWNDRCPDIMPGSQIYLPLAESQFFSGNEALNQQIVELAKHRL